MAKTRVRINEDNWIVKVVTSLEMMDERDDGEGLAGLCIPDRKVILIEENNITERVILHEIVHSYWSNLHLGDTNDLTLDDAEEIAASLFSEKGETMIKKAKKITKALKKGLR